MKKELLCVVVLAFVCAVFVAGCDWLEKEVTGDDGNKSCSIGVNIATLQTGCKYHITLMLYGCDADFVTWSFDDGYWRDMDMRGMDSFTFEQVFPGPGVYAINVHAWRDGEIVASRSDGLAIDCK